tara:strand:+ start:1550 stop:2455 length:906 start_codon:yes stop_codon:yes gene_type:complete
MVKSKLLMMVITSDTYPAKRNSKAQKLIYKNKKNDFNAIWYKGNDSLMLPKQGYSLKNNDLVLNCSNDTRAMGEKTLLAFDWALKNYDFEFLIRPTPSSYINVNYIEKLVKKDLKDDILYAGTVHEFEEKNGNKFNFISGSTLLLNKKCVQLIVENKNLWNHNYWDDVALADLLLKLDVPQHNLERTDIKGNPFKQNVDINNYQFRCRADNHYFYPRVIEANVLKVLDDIICEKKISLLRKFLLNLYFEIAKVFYIYQFSWKLYSFLKKITKHIIPDLIYKKLKNLLHSQITRFKHKRFKY